jgi:DNA-binding transcriptional LysR family regulator
MHHRYEQINIPTEILRSVVALSQTGSFSKAAQRLNLSQPAISAQIKRLQSLVGGSVFEKSIGALIFTDLGKTILSLATRLLELNDQILLLRGADTAQICRVGIASLYVESFLKYFKHIDRSNVTYMSDHSSALTKAYNSGFLDIVCIRSPETNPDVLISWEEPMCWIRSASFVQSPGKPIPLVSWPGDDQPAATALEKSNQLYSVIFTSPDHQARIRAVAAGLGVMAIPAREVTAPTLVATDDYLPSLPPIRFSVVARPEKVKSFPQVLEAMKGMSLQNQPTSRIGVLEKESRESPR